MSAPDDVTKVPSNFDDLRECVADARAALSKVAPPTPEADNPLYYPLLFLTRTVESTLREVLRRAHEEMRQENEGAAAWLAEANRAAEEARHAAP